MCEGKLGAEAPLAEPATTSVEATRPSNERRRPVTPRRLSDSRP